MSAPDPDQNSDVALAVEFNRAIVRHFADRGLGAANVHDVCIAAVTILDGYLTAITDETARIALLERIVASLRARVAGGGSA